MLLWMLTMPIWVCLYFNDWWCVCTSWYTIRTTLILSHSTRHTCWCFLFLFIIHILYTVHLIQFRVMRGAGAYPRYHSWEAGYTQVFVPSHGQFQSHEFWAAGECRNTRREPDEKPSYCEATQNKCSFFLSVNLSFTYFMQDLRIKLDNVLFMMNYHSTHCIFMNY